MVKVCQGMASEDWPSGVIAGLFKCKAQKQEGKWKKWIAGAGTNEQLVIAGEAGGGTCPSWWRIAYAIPGVG